MSGLTATVIAGQMDLDHQAYQPQLVFLNGQYWGIYNFREKINADNIGALFNINPDDINRLSYPGIFILML